MLDWQESGSREFHYARAGWRLDVVGWETGAAWYASYCGKRIAWANARGIDAAKEAGEQYLNEQLNKKE